MCVREKKNGRILNKNKKNPSAKERNKPFSHISPERADKETHTLSHLSARERRDERAMCTAVLVEMQRVKAPAQSREYTVCV